MIVIGADTHKYQHSLAAVDEGTGRQRAGVEIAADQAGYLAAVRWARGLDRERVWALEDCRHDQRAMEIRILFDHRESLIGQRTRVGNQLRWQLIELWPELERSLTRGAISQPRTLARIECKLRSLTGARARVARHQLSQIRALTRQADQSQAELAELISSYRPALLSEQGCGVLTAAILIGHTARAQKLASNASFARLAGTAPIPCSSGTRTQHRLDRGGDRQLNRALHTIAITRARHDPTTQQYLARKRAEGKTDKGALRSLKRHLARRIHRLLTQPPLPDHTTRPTDPAPSPPNDHTITAPPPATCLA